jgi:chromosome segregation ATPase
MTTSDNISRLYEDIGSLKALVASIDAKLDDNTRETRALREEQVQMKMEVSQIKSSAESREASTRRIEQSLHSVETQVEKLNGFKMWIATVIAVVGAVGTVVYSAWGLIEQFLEFITRTPK